MGIEAASVYASFEANIAPLDQALAEMDDRLAATAEQAAATTDVVAALADGAAVAAEGLDATGAAADDTAAQFAFLGQAGQEVSNVQAELASQAMQAQMAEEGLAESSAAAGGSLDVMAAAGTVANTAMMGLAGAGIAVGLATAGAKAAFDGTVGSAVALGDQVRKLQLTVGGSAEDMSKLLYAANMTGLSVDTLTRSMDIAIRALQSSKSQGIEPNIDGLARLADEYNGIADPVQRTAFLLHEFGRSGAEMAPLMQLGGDGIRQLGEQASIAGAVLTGSGVDSVHAYDLAVNKLHQDLAAAGADIGLNFTGIATQIARGADVTILAQQLLNKARQDGIVSAFGYDAEELRILTTLTGSRDVYLSLLPQVQAFDQTQSQMDLGTRHAGDSLAWLSDQLQGSGDMMDNVSLHASRFQQQAQADADATAQLAAQQAALNETFRGGTQVTLSQADSVEKLLGNNSKLGAAQGALIPQAKNYNELVLGSAVAHDQLAAAQARNAQAQEALVKNTDPKKWESLGAAVDSAQLAVLRANDAYNASVKAAQDAAGGVADYTGAIEKNTQAIKDSMDTDFGQSIVNQLSKVDVGSKAYNNLYTELQLVNPTMAKQFELASSTTAAQNLLNDAVAHGVIPAQDAAKFFAIFSAQVAAGHDPLVGLAQISGEIASDKMPALTSSLQTVVTVGLSPAELAAEALMRSIENIPSQKDVHVDYWVTNHVTTLSGPGSGGASTTTAPPAGDPNKTRPGSGPGAATGATFDVPAGYSESYPVGPYRASSGERVTITRPGEAAGRAMPGGTTNVYINDRLAAALYLERARQDRLALLDRSM